MVSEAPTDGEADSVRQKVAELVVLHVARLPDLYVTFQIYLLILALVFDNAALLQCQVSVES